MSEKLFNQNLVITLDQHPTHQSHINGWEQSAVRCDPVTRAGFTEFIRMTI